MTNEENLSPSRTELFDLVQSKHFDRKDVGWGPRLRKKFLYFTPDDYYECIVRKLINNHTKWIDIGCGRSLFPSNERLAAALSKTAKLLVGIDPDRNINENKFLHQKFEGPIEKFRSTEKFDLVTLRMVAEHIEKPEQICKAISNISAEKAFIVIYTPNKYSPVSIVSKLSPMWFHHSVKTFLWRVEKKDTFPAYYRLNTRKSIKEHMNACGFSEIFFEFVDDCRTTGRFIVLNCIELTLWKILNRLHVRYPENCLVGVYQKVS